MLIDCDNNNWILSHPYEPNWILAVKELRGRSYNAINKTWVIPKLVSLEEIEEKFSGYIINYSDNIRNSSYFLDTKNEQHLYKYQHEDVKKALKMQRFLLGLDMGMGKTIEAIAFCKILLEAKLIDNVVVIVPKSLRHQWQNEIKKFSGYDSLILNKSFDFMVDSEFKFYITNKERIRIAKPVFGSRTTVVLDEVTHMKNPKSAIYKAILAATKNVTYMLSMTGTAIENSLVDFWTILKLMYPDFISTNEFYRNYAVFDEVWTGARYINKLVGFKNVKDFALKAKRYYVRHTKDELVVLLPKNYQLREIDASSEQVAIQRHLLNLVNSEKNSNKRLGILQLLRTAMSETSNLNATISDIIQGANFKVNDAKINEIKEIMDETSSKIIVFTAFKETAKTLHNRLGGYLVTSDTKDNEVVIEKFKREEHVRLLITTDTLSYGVNLDEADVLVHYDMVWNPAKMRQREDRIHRGNSTRQKTIITLVSDTWIEKRLYEVLQQKKDLADEVLISDIYV